MTEYVYDEEASAALHMDVVHEVDAPPSRSTWVEAMRRLNRIEDPLARRLVRLHIDCGSGVGECDDVEEYDGESVPVGWGCETMEIIAGHFGVQYPVATDGY
ncbi:hypothetical protein ACIB24_16810 [Spongisporangium articulatum]|uniref:Uncharacterized protein n=1 Tax=Spongisporangium articulatum TaxID=3362603 RepID=A0ABW8AQV8_9ACTN